MKRTTYTAKYKSDRVIEVLKGDAELGAIAAKYNISPNLLRKWRQEFCEKAPQLFEESRRERELAAKEQELEAEREELLKTVGQLTVERDWLKKKSIEVFGHDYEKRFSKKPF